MSENNRKRRGQRQPQYKNKLGKQLVSAQQDRSRTRLSVIVRGSSDESHGRWRQRLSGRASARCCREPQGAKDVSEPTPENGVPKSHSWSGCLRVMWCCRHQISSFEASAPVRRHLEETDSRRTCHALSLVTVVTEEKSKIQTKASVEIGW